MRFDPQLCPVCGAQPTSVREILYVDAFIYDFGDGELEYEGESDVDWDTQQMSVDERDGTVYLHSKECGHDPWKAKLLEG